MSLLYDRFETTEQVEYRFKFLPLFYVALGVATLLSFVSRGERTNGVIRGFGLLMLAWMAGVWKPMMEIERAMAHGTVEMTGSRFSFSNPPRVILRKQEALGKMPESIPGRAGIETL